jgi:3-methyladenine DNA glycosylase AlkC
MNPEDMTSEQRLQQIEILLSTAAKTINRTTERSERNAEAIERLSGEGIELRLAIGRLSEMFAESVGIIRQQQANIEKMQSEIWGLHVENQRILQRVF